MSGTLEVDDGGLGTNSDLVDDDEGGEVLGRDVGPVSSASETLEAADSEL